MTQHAHPLAKNSSQSFPSSVAYCENPVEEIELRFKARWNNWGAEGKKQQLVSTSNQTHPRQGGRRGTSGTSSGSWRRTRTTSASSHPGGPGRTLSWRLGLKIGKLKWWKTIEKSTKALDWNLCGTSKGSDEVEISQITQTDVGRFFSFHIAHLARIHSEAKTCSASSSKC